MEYKTQQVFDFEAQISVPQSQNTGLAGDGNASEFGAPERPSVVPQTLADVIAALKTVPGLTTERRRDLTSAVRRICTLLNADPSDLPVQYNALRPRISRLTAEGNNLAPQTLRNVQSAYRAALRATGATCQRAYQLAPAWEPLRGLLPSKAYRDGLISLLRFCTQMQIEPAQVNDRTATEFGSWLEANSTKSHWRGIHRRACKLWNDAVRTIPGWPSTILALPDYRKPPQSRALEEFPKSFQDELPRYGSWLVDRAPFRPHRPPHICKPSTVKQRRKEILLAASALIRSGMEIGAITSLAVLVERQNVESILTDYWNKTQEVTRGTRSIYRTLFIVARYWVRRPQEDLDQLRELGQSMGPEPSGLTEKNMDVLRFFYAHANVAKLFAVPTKLAEMARAEGGSAQKKAILMQLAVVIEILIHAPIRMHNLISIRIGKQLLRPAGPNGQYLLVFVWGETKNDQRLEYELPPETTALIDEYLSTFRPAFGVGADGWLFPSLARDQKAQSTLAGQIAKTVEMHVGKRMTGHQFRHLIGALILDRHPGALHLVQRLLGHKDPKTTLRFYAGLNPLSASRQMAELVANARAKVVQ